MSTSSPQPRPADQARPAVGGVDKSGARVREMFRQIAPHYDRLNHLLSLNIDRYWRWRTVRMLKIRGGDPVLDVCTGTGDLAHAIAARVDPEVRVVGSDFCGAMLRIARKKGTRQKPRPIATEFIEADAQVLPFSDDLFQCVTVAFGLRNVADTDRGLAEMMRVCRPGGQVVVLEFSRPTFPGLKQLYNLYFRVILPKIGQWMSRNDQSAYEYLPASVSQFPSGEALAARMRGVGLIDVAVAPLTLGVVTVYQGFKAPDFQSSDPPATA